MIMNIYIFAMKKSIERRYTKMAIQFNQHKGAAQKSSITSFQYKDGDNSFRLVGDILARYVYWVKGENDKTYNIEDVERYRSFKFS